MPAPLQMAYNQHIHDSAPVSARCVVITLSDTRTEETDTSGRRIRDMLAETGHRVLQSHIIHDEAAELHHLLTDMLARTDIDAVLTNGGTGISRRDRTIEVVERHLDQILPGFGELFRQLSWEQIGSGAIMSRAVGGIGRGKAIFAMPGSTNAVELAMSRLILPELGHLISELRK